MKLKPADYQSIFTEIKKMANQYFNDNEEIKSLYLYKNLNIEFIVSTENTSRAYSKRQSKNNFSVFITRDFIDELYNIASNYSNDASFMSLFIPNFVNKKALRNYLFYFYVDLIICHEWAHIFCGHLDFIHYQSQIGNLGFLQENSCKVNKALELEADSMAARLVLARLAANYNNINRLVFSDITSKEDIIDIWRLFVFALISLFESLSGKNSKTHPQVSHRVFTSIMFVAGEIAEKREIREALPKICTSNNEQEIIQTFMSYNLDFYQKYKLLSLQDIAASMKEDFEHCSKIGKVIHNININDYRLIRAKWI